MTPLTFFLPGTFITMSQGIAMPYAQVGAMAEMPRFAGTAAGVGVFMQNFFAAVFAQLYGLLADGTPWPMAAIALCGGVLMPDRRRGAVRAGAAAAGISRTVVRIRAVGWVEPKAKPIEPPCAKRDGFRCAQPILRAARRFGFRPL